ncbi:SH3 domain-containing protein [Chitinophaga arvensicola]|uniref:SH3 domain-containing protein n=1 Tax=Chitinophaga arvensicola TaxID=29529 RepID=A0A1I0S6X8_9BACT|nr:SH3 domain-containing protein [Chitinophaga arvensicola]SEW51441.1 SH3 domain-containing protein [Chitinophaga arvensicola]
MKFTFCMLLIFVCSPLWAQFALVEDKDGYTNVREEGALSAPVVARVTSGSLVYIYEAGKDWSQVDYKQDSTGYIHNSRLRKIANYEPVPVQRVAGDSIVFRKDSLMIVLRQMLFQPSAHRFKYQQTEGGRYLSAIDNRPFWGTDGGAPDRAYQHISCYWQHGCVVAPDSAINDLFQPNLELTHVWYDRQHERWFIEATNSDGAGGYVVAWMFEQGKYKTRCVVHGF